MLTSLLISIGAANAVVWNMGLAMELAISIQRMLQN